MPSYNSKDGVWKPAVEKVALFDASGEPYVYEGPDRAAQEYLKEVGEEHLGMPFYQDPEVIDRAHERRMTIDEFCKTKIHTEEKREKAFAEASSKKVLHHTPVKKPAQRQTQTGGTNTAGTSGHLEGGFGDLQEAITKTETASKKGK